MSERTSYAPGTPCWVELSGMDDIERSADFYGKLFGWEVPERENSAELGGYRRAQLGGKDVAGVMPRMDEGNPAVWATYVSVVDADATLAKVRDGGGTVMVEPMDVMGMGKMAVFTDPTGAVCGIWEPGSFPGAEIVNEYGAFGWNELGTRDVGASREFYGAVFGWEVEEQDMGEMGTYTIWKDGDEVRGGAFDVNGVLPDEIPAHWLVYFSVEDCDAAIETAKANGGDLRNGPMDIAPGRFAVLADPDGAVFAVLQPSQENLENAP